MKTTGIWKYENLLNPKVEIKNRFTIGEGNTPLQENAEIAKILKLEKLYFKREDMNPTGSHKDRGLAFQISSHIQDGKKEFAISSSGNAAISAMNLLKNTPYTLHIFLSSKLSVSKIHRLVKCLDEKISIDIFKGRDTNFENFRFHFSKKPLSTLFLFSKEHDITSLRGSTDRYGYEGFKTIAYELDVDTDAIFIPSSSGTTAKGIYEGFCEKGKLIPFHIIQTTKVNTLVHRFDKNYNPSIHSTADAIVDRIGHRVREIEEILKKTKGSGWIISDSEILKAQEILKTHNIVTSNESALTIAGIMKAKSKRYKFKKPVCIFTGVA